MSALRTDLLEQAIGAARAGQRPTARGLLQAILADDPTDIQAWLWLSGVVDDPAEQVKALEHVLELEPSNARAAYGLKWMREQHPEIWLPPPAPIPPPTPAEEREPSPTASVFSLTEPMNATEVAEPEPVVTPPAQANGSTERMIIPPVSVPVSPIDEELRCPYCGALASAEQLDCPACQRSLVVSEERRRGAQIARTLLASLALIVAVGAIGGSIWLLLFAQPFASLNAELVSAAGFVLLGLAALGVAMMIGMFRRWRGVYGLDLVLTLAAVAGLIMLLLAAFNLIPSVLMLPTVIEAGDIVIFNLIVGACLVFMLLRLGLLLGARREFFPRRGRVRLSTQVLSGGEHFRNGGRYRDRGWHWAAARELERAVADEPHKLKYRRALADAYAKIGDQARARDELRASVNLDPDTSPMARAGSLAKDVQRERQ